MACSFSVRAALAALCFATGTFAVSAGRAADTSAAVPTKSGASPAALTTQPGTLAGNPTASALTQSTSTAAQEDETGVTAAVPAEPAASGTQANLASPADAAAGPDIIGVETGGTAGITVRLGEDLANLIDDGITRRLFPMVGHGGIQNIADLMDGRAGIDMALLQLDVLDYARTQRMFPDIENKITYVAKLNYVEFHLLAGPEITSIADLGGHIVNVGASFGDTSITAAQLFKVLKVELVPGNDEPGLAIEKLRRGEIAAVAFVGGKPAPALRGVDTTGLHLVPIPLTPEVIAAYIPTKLSATDYPGLISRDAPVETVAIGTGLFVGPAAPGSDEYRKLTSVIDTLFTQFQTLLAPGHHGKWAEVNLTGQIPGWQRFAPADDWLKRNAAVAAGQDLRVIFMHFLDERDKATGTQLMSQQEKDALFDQFRRWQSGKSN